MQTRETSPLDKTHDDLLALARLLGLLGESPEWYTKEVATHVHAGGVPVSDMTAGDLVAAIRCADEALGLPTKDAPEGGVGG